MTMMSIQMHSTFEFPTTSYKRFFDKEEEYYPTNRIENSWKTRKEDMYASRRRIEPSANDVLMGRGGKNNQHSGNEKLRELARERCQEYMRSSKKGKSSISRQLVRRMFELDPPARFLKRNTETSEWEEVGEDTAREKASQVLRDAVASLTEGRETPYMFQQEQKDDTGWASSEVAGVASTIAEASAAEISFPSDSPRPRKRRRSTGHTSPMHFQGQDIPTPAAYSPVRRYSEYSSYARPEAIASTAPRAIPTHHRVTRRMSASGVGTGLLGDFPAHMNEFDLFNGQLLESDPEDDIEPLPP